MPLDDRYVRSIMDGLLADPAVALAYEQDAAFHAWIINTAQVLAMLVPAMGTAAECNVVLHKKATEDLLRAGQTVSGVYATTLDEDGDPIPGTRRAIDADARAQAAIATAGVTLQGPLSPPFPKQAGRRAGPDKTDPRDPAFVLADPVPAESADRALARRASPPPNQETP